jgi:MFS transporter, DHA1 family, inner membrane transport protein
VQRAHPRLLLVVATLATFLVTTTGSSLAPYLKSVAGDLGRDLAAASILVSAQALSWGGFSLVAGSLSDRVGRRPILAGSLLVLGFARLAFARCESYESALAMQIVTGIGGGAFMASIFAAVADRVPPEERGSALGWVITGQSLSLVLGVPLVTLLGDFGGWRVAIAAHGSVVAVAALVVWYAVLPDHPGAHRSAEEPVSLRDVVTGPTMCLLLAGTMERIGFATMAIYFALFLQSHYGVSFSRLALAMFLVALGNLAGNTLGGRIADRSRRRVRLFAVALGTASIVVLPLMAWPLNLWLSVTLGAFYSAVNALGRPALMATLSDVPREVRGALLGFNITMASMGWLAAGAIGGFLVTHAGFAAVGAMCAGAGACGTGFALWHERLMARKAGGANGPR